MKSKYYTLVVTFNLLVMVSGAQVATRADTKIYGYSQVTLPGTIPVETDESGNRLPDSGRKEPEPAYHIYICGKAAMKISALYIKGVAYTIQQERVLHTPVYEERPELPENKKKKVLVPKTSSAVFRLSPAAQTGKSAAKYLQPLINKSELLVVYTVSGKQYTASLKKIIVLEPIAMY